MPKAAKSRTTSKSRSRSSGKPSSKEKKRPPLPELPPADIPEYARAPLVAERLGRLAGVASLLPDLARDCYDQDAGLEVLAHVVQSETDALTYSLEIMGVHERLCPDTILPAYKSEQEEEAHV